jgi:hypothetical protein
MLNARAEQDEFRVCAEKLRAEGKASEAESCERRGGLAPKPAELERHRVELEVQRVELEAKQMAAMRAFAEQTDSAGRSGRDAQLADLSQIRALEAEAEAEVNRARALDAKVHARSVRQVSEEFAKALADQVEAWKAQLEHDPQSRLELEREIERLDAALRALEAKPRP